MIWTDTNKAEAAELWRSGQSAATIADKFGCSRNSIIGVMHRNRDIFKRPTDREPSVPKTTDRQAKPGSRKISIRPQSFGPREPLSPR
jgi:hypothetical protein